MRFYFIIFFAFLLIVAPAQNTRRDIDSIQNIIRTTKHPDRLAAEKATLLLKYFLSGEQKKSMALYKEALNEAIKTKADSGLAMLYHTRGSIFYYETVYDSALHYFEKALAIRKKINDTIGILKSTGNIGSMYYMFGDLEKALSYYEETRKKEAELNYPEGKYFSITNLGSIYLRLKMLDKASLYFRKAEKIYLQDNALAQLIYVYDGLSDIYKELHKMDSALYYAHKVKEISEALNEKRSLSYAYNTIGIIYKHQEKYDLAKEYFNTALQLTRKLKDKRLEMTLYANLAAVEVQQNNVDNARGYIEKVVKLKEELNITANQADLAKLFAEYYFYKGDFKNAYEQVVLYDRYSDSLYNIANTGKLAEMQEKYDVEKKERENRLLQIENEGHKATRNYLLIIIAIALLGVAGAVVAYRKIKTANHSLAIQKELVEEKQKEILDSIHYAKRIQFALLAGDSLLNKHLPEHFVLFKPKDVVSGDFYWAAPTSTGLVYITADCTGHGVPGAFMSLLNISKLSQVVNENKIERPDLILNSLRSEIIQALNPTGSQQESKDGMDAVLCKLNLKDMKLEYAAANNSFYIVRKGFLLICKSDKMPVGKGHDDTLSFTYNEMALQKGDVIYTFTDGFADQFGGDKGKKFKYKQLEELLLSISADPMSVQKQKLEAAFENWKGQLEQVDDVCILGVRV